MNFDSVGRVSCLLLLLSVFLLVNPTTTSANALAIEETGGVEEDAIYDDQIASISDDEIMTLADTGVTISLTPTSGTTSITPVTTEGSLARIDVKAKVDITNTGGYSIYLSGQNANLTGEKTGQTIAAATSSTTFSNIATNTWAYAAVEGTSIPDTATYSGLPVGQGATLKSVNGNKDSASHTYMLSFAAKIASSKPTDTYKNQISLSVTASPKVLTLSQLTNMQDMTTASCSISAVGETKQLKDVRDGKYYWTTKLADQKCWMTQNLAFDLSTGTALSNETTDLQSKTSWTPGYSTETSVTSSNIVASNTGQGSWNLGSYYIKSPNGTSSCGTGRSNLASCTSYFTALATPTSANGNANAHYLVGNFYQWNAVTAGSGGAITSGLAQDSICPKGWRLPTYTNATIGSYSSLATAGSISDVATLTAAPYYFVKAGNVWQDATKLFAYAGSNGTYWTATPDSDGWRSNTLYFIDSIIVGNFWGRQLGLSARCIAR